MKWLKRIAIAVALLIIAILGLAIATARRTDHPVGFQTTHIETASGPVAVALWYPTSALAWPTTFINGSLVPLVADGPVSGGGLPVIVISHGSGGSALSRIDLAMDLASAGYVVAAPTHAGDNYADQRRQGNPMLFRQRAEQLQATTDYVLSAWTGAAHVDPQRVGTFGFSAGAFSVLGLIGGFPDMTLIADHCTRHPEFICKALDHVRSPLLTTAAGAGSFITDQRIKAAVIAAPGLGFTFGRGGLESVRIPVQVWHGSRDTTVPFQTNAGIVLAGLGILAESKELAGASHLSFLAPCGLLRPPALCSDPEGFDRESAHQRMNAEIIHFFNTTLLEADKQHIR